MGPKQLFVHWGPGGNADIERAWFNNSLPIHWWNQPLITNEILNPFNHIVESALNEAKKMGPGPLHVYAHSFGGQIAAEMMRQAPGAINSLTLLGAGIWPPQGIINLAEKLVKLGHNELSDIYEEIKVGFSIEKFWKLATTVAGIPNFTDHYWAPNSSTAKQKYAQLLVAQGTPSLDMGTYVAVTNDYISMPTKTGPISFDGNVRLIIGEYDPLLSYADIVGWKKLFPKISIKNVKAGHFVQFECDPKIWR